MAKDTASVEGWSITLRVRVQRKKRIQMGRVRGRYEGKTAHAIVRAPNGELREIYLGSGSRLKRSPAGADPKGEEVVQPASTSCRLEVLEKGGRTGGKKARRTDGWQRDNYVKGLRAKDERESSLGEPLRGFGAGYRRGMKPKYR